jgi:beta-N-acetylhexosaminidase
MRILRVAAAAVLAASVLAACAPMQSPSPRATTTPLESPTRTQAPTPTPTTTEQTDTKRAAELVDQMSLRERAAAVVMAQIPGTDPAAVEAGFESGAGNLILMGDGVAADEVAQKAMLDAATAGRDPRPLIAIDEEGGDVTRLPWDTLPSARDLKGADPAAVEDAFVRRGELLAQAGISVNFGVVADPGAVAAAVEAAVRGEAGNALTTLKHFPGHGAAAGDSHSSIPTSDEGIDDWLASDAVPFRAGIEAGAPLVMMGHLSFTAIAPEPASLSPEWYAILRDELGFEGVAVTDDIGMLTSSGEPEYADVNDDAVAALGAGADLVLFVAGSGPEENAVMVDRIARAVDDGELSAERLDEAATRVTALRIGLEE